MLGSPIHQKVEVLVHKNMVWIVQSTTWWRTDRDRMKVAPKLMKKVEKLWERGLQ